MKVIGNVERQECRRWLNIATHCRLATVPERVLGDPQTTEVLDQAIDTGRVCRAIEHRFPKHHGFCGLGRPLEAFDVSRKAFPAEAQLRRIGGVFLDLLSFHEPAPKRGQKMDRHQELQQVRMDLDPRQQIQRVGGFRNGYTAKELG